MNGRLGCTYVEPKPFPALLHSIGLFISPQQVSACETEVHRYKSAKLERRSVKVNKKRKYSSFKMHAMILILVCECCAVHYVSSTTMSATSALPTQLQASSPMPSLNISTVDCEVDCEVDYFTCNSSLNRSVCRCDEQLCTQFRDC